MFCNKSLGIILFTAAFTVPGVYGALTGMELSAPMQALLAGGAILAASFIMLWACDAAQTDIPQTLALAVVALIAVLPEYAVDMYFTWQAGRNPGMGYEHYAIANMTGANRLIIGVAWTLVVAIFWFKTRRAVLLDEERQLEIRFLAAATLYALLIPIKGSLAWYDGVVFMGLYAWYIMLASKRPQVDVECEGPAEWIASLPSTKRRFTFISMFVFAAFVIVANAERFSEGLLGMGKAYGINEFLLVQWLAPIASEAPEFVVAIMFAMRKQASVALGSLLSAKLNQWTLLVGMIPGVYALATRHIVPMPMDTTQNHEVLLTAAQSLLAVVMLAMMRLTAGQALLLFGLFAGQLVSPLLVDRYLGGEFMGMSSDAMHPIFSFLYLSAALALLVDRPERMQMLWPFHRRAAAAVEEPEITCEACGHVLAEKLLSEDEVITNEIAGE
jgi:cation:H+ antiporter